MMMPSSLFIFIFSIVLEGETQRFFSFRLTSFIRSLKAGEDWRGEMKMEYKRCLRMKTTTQIVFFAVAGK
jgi:hypothetical protein